MLRFKFCLDIDIVALLFHQNCAKWAGYVQVLTIMFNALIESPDKGGHRG